MAKWKIANMLEMGRHGAKRIEILDSRVVSNIYVGYLLSLMFKVIWGSFGVLGHWSHECLMSLRGFPKDCVVHGNFPQGAVVIRKAWLLGVHADGYMEGLVLGVHADATFQDGKGQ